MFESLRPSATVARELPGTLQESLDLILPGRFGGSSLRREAEAFARVRKWRLSQTGNHLGHFLDNWFFAFAKIDLYLFVGSF